MEEEEKKDPSLSDSTLSRDTVTRQEPGAMNFPAGMLTPPRPRLPPEHFFEIEGVSEPLPDSKTPKDNKEMSPSFRSGPSGHKTRREER